MENSSTEKKTNYVPEIVVGIGYALLLCLVPLTFLGLYYFTVPKNMPAEEQYAFAINLPPLTPTSHLPLDFKPGELNIFKDEFNDNQNSWSHPRLEIEDGKLVLESEYENSYAHATCSKCPYLSQPFFMQAEFSTDKLYEYGYGFVFKMNYQQGNFLLFSINPTNRSYDLYSHTAGGWALQIFGQSNEIQPFPKFNTIGIYINKTYIEFYINNKLVDTYQDTGTSLQSGNIGVYIDDGSAKLLVDNLIVDIVESE